MDIAQCVKAMQDGLGQMFDDPRLSPKARGKKNEVEAGFLAMRNLASMLSAIQAEYETAKVQAAVPTATVATEVSKSSNAPSPVGGEAGGETTVRTEEAATTSVAVEGGAPAAAAPAPVADGPSQERTANRERTPPPGSRKRSNTCRMLSSPDHEKPNGATRRELQPPLPECDVKGHKEALKIRGRRYKAAWLRQRSKCSRDSCKIKQWFATAISTTATSIGNAVAECPGGSARM